MGGGQALLGARHIVHCPSLLGGATLFGQAEDKSEGDSPSNVRACSPTVTSTCVQQVGEVPDTALHFPRVARPLWD